MLHLNFISRANAAVVCDCPSVPAHLEFTKESPCPASEHRKLSLFC